MFYFIISVMLNIKNKVKTLQYLTNTSDDILFRYRVLSKFDATHFRINFFSRI